MKLEIVFCMSTWFKPTMDPSVMRISEPCWWDILWPIAVLMLEFFVFFQILICHNYVLTFGTTAVLHDGDKQEVAPWQHYTACLPMSRSMLTVYDLYYTPLVIGFALSIEQKTINALFPYLLTGEERYVCQWASNTVWKEVNMWRSSVISSSFLNI